MAHHQLHSQIRIPPKDKAQDVGADADLSHMPIGDWAMEIELRAASGLNFVVL